MDGCQCSMPFCPVHHVCFSCHGLCGSNKLLYKRCAFLMGKAKFRPPSHSSYIFSWSFWNSKLRNASGTQTWMQNFVKFGSPGASGRTPKFWPYILGYPFNIFFVFFAQRPGRKNKCTTFFYPPIFNASPKMWHRRHLSLSLLLKTDTHYPFERPVSTARANGCCFRQPSRRARRAAFLPMSDVME